MISICNDNMGIKCLVDDICQTINDGGTMDLIHTLTLSTFVDGHAMSSCQIQAIWSISGFYKSLQSLHAEVSDPICATICCTTSSGLGKESIFKIKEYLFCHRSYIDEV